MKLEKLSIELGEPTPSEEDPTIKIVKQKKDYIKIKGKMSVCVETDFYRVVKFKVTIYDYYDNESSVSNSITNGKIKAIISMIAGIMHNNKE